MSDCNAIYNVQTDKKVVALTFDIGNGNKTPAMVLDVLEQKGVKNVTFFLAAPWVSKHPEVAKRIRMMGLEIGSHGYLHKNYSEHSDDWIYGQIKKAEEIIFGITGVKTNLIRTPNGDFDQRVLKKLHAMGYKTIHWSADSIDWMNPGVDVIVHRVLSKAQPGVIILMHASDTARQTGEAVPRIIDGLRDRGYKFVAVSELINLENERT